MSESSASERAIFALRQYEPRRDIGFLRDSWIRSNAKGMPMVLRDRAWSFESYREYHRSMVTHLLERSETVIACNPDWPDQIYGYAVAEPTRDRPVLHYVNIKLPYRSKFGLLPSLLAGAGVHRKTPIWVTTWSRWCTKEKKYRSDNELPPLDFCLYKLLPQEVTL